MCNTDNTNFAGTRDAANRVIRFDIRQGKLAQWMGRASRPVSTTTSRDTSPASPSGSTRCLPER